MYVLDTGNNRVRQVSTAGTISAYAGSGFTLATTGNGGPAITAGLSTPEGEVFDAAGDVFIADSANNRIQEIAAHQPHPVRDLDDRRGRLHHRRAGNGHSRALR